MGLSFSLKVCYDDTMEMRCAHKDYESDRGQDEEYFDPLYNQGNPSANPPPGYEQYPDGAFSNTIPGSDPWLGGDANFPEDPRDNHVGWIPATLTFGSEEGDPDSHTCPDGYPEKNCDSFRTVQVNLCRCFRCKDSQTYTPKYVATDARKGLVEFSFDPTVRKKDGDDGGDRRAIPKADCPDVGGLIKFRLDAKKPDGSWNMNAFWDEDFLLEGCLDLFFAIEACLIQHYAAAVWPIVHQIKEGANKLGVNIELGGAFLELCAKLRTLGFEDPTCRDPQTGREPKYMPLNPGLSGALGYRMDNYITVPRISSACTTVTLGRTEWKWTPNGCGGCGWSGCWHWDCHVARWITWEHRVSGCACPIDSHPPSQTSSWHN